MADEMVLATQQWLNKTYGNIPEFDKCPEDGKTGWPTIYSLIEGLQIELEIPHENLSPNFGPTTSQKFDEKVTPNLKPGYSGNIVQLIQGAFWCKGISPGGFDGEYSGYTRAAINELQSDAGFSPTGQLTSMWAKALFDMSAFVLVPGGDSKVRGMQQWLNANYYTYFGIMPCDGIYQRDTNSALIYALQSELGYSPEEATGAYGDGTTSKTYPVKEGDSGEYVKIIQYGLYANGYYQAGNFDGYFSSYMGDEVLSFRQFMILPEYTRIADVVVIKGLLSSAGYTNRETAGADTSTQLTLSHIQTLVDAKVKIVGRYLTGSVGVGEDKRDKFLTVDELNNLFSAGLSVFPIYQDGGWDIDYFNASQGNLDAFTAGEAAKQLGIPMGTVIYFAVDVDIQDGDINGTVLPYFGSVYEELIKAGYRVGVYGTRNVCSRVINQGYATYAFVSDMSTGFSGNLGYSMPDQWAFDQIEEVTIGSGVGAVGIDKVGVSNRDRGFNALSDGTEEQEIRAYNQKVIDQMLKDYQVLLTAGLDNPWNPHLTLYRYQEYYGTSWGILSSPVTAHDKAIFDDYIKTLENNGTLYTYFIDPNSKKHIGLSHLFVTLQSEMFFTDSIKDTVSDFAGWTGDLMTIWGQVKKAGVQMEQSIYLLVGNDSGTFSLEYLYQDVDAINVYEISQRTGDSTALTSLQNYYVNNGCRDRFNQFIVNRFGGSNKIQQVTNSVLANDEHVDIIETGIITFFISEIVNKIVTANFSYLDFIGDEDEIASGFAKKIIEFQQAEG